MHRMDAQGHFFYYSFDRITFVELLFCQPLSSVLDFQGLGNAEGSNLSNGFPCAVAKVAGPSGHRAVSLMWSQSNQSRGLPRRCLCRTVYQAWPAWNGCKPPNNKVHFGGLPQAKPLADYARRRKGGWLLPY